jgi:hypothetical protein
METTMKAIQEGIMLDPNTLYNLRNRINSHGISMVLVAAISGHRRIWNLLLDFPDVDIHQMAGHQSMIWWARRYGFEEIENRLRLSGAREISAMDSLASYSLMNNLRCDLINT